MKLPDFILDEGLNKLRQAMNAELRTFKPAPSIHTLTTEEIERLASEGIEVPIEDVQVLNDGTHFYKGRRVIVYIRDTDEYGDRISLPKFHIAMCETLERMIEEGRYKKRYVVATRDDGLFRIHKIQNGRISSSSDEALLVCQNCLHELHYNGFFMQMKKSVRHKSVETFLVKEFFADYGKSCVWAMPRYDADNAPPNIYSPHFYRIAKAIKEQRGYKCENPTCRIDLSKPENRRFLHAHHIDADKSDNHPSNIRLLCIRCHANEFQHSHLRESPDYEEFSRKFPLRWLNRNQYNNNV
jgi:hypothetical protein